MYISTVTLHFQLQDIMVWRGQKNSYMTDKDQGKRNILTLKYSTEYGIVTNWNNMERRWLHHFYDGLLMASEEYLLHLTMAPISPKASKE
jgi:actin-related protein